MISIDTARKELGFSVHDISDDELQIMIDTLQPLIDLFFHGCNDNCRVPLIDKYSEGNE